MRTVFFGILVSLFFLAGSSLEGQINATPVMPARILDEGRCWADSVYDQLTEEERIAQLFWIAVNAWKHPENEHPQMELLKRWQPGGVLFFKDDLRNVVHLVNKMQALSKVPLFTVADGEWGLGMRFDDAMSFPYAMTLGAIQNDEILYDFGLEVARQYRLMGLNVNLAPVSDVNNNPDNPVIGFRSFGEDPERVGAKAALFMRGLQDGRVMAVAKHFPGHGDTDQDSHQTLPSIGHSRNHLNAVELRPFSELVHRGVWGVMTAHLVVPALESGKRLPASFSKQIVEGVLRDSLGFNGLVITDAVNMKGAKTMGAPGVVDALALMAGNDVVAFTEDLPGAIKEVKKKLADGSMPWSRIEKKCKRSLAFKYYMGLSRTSVVDDASLVNRLNTPGAKWLQRQLYERSVTVLANRDSVIPLRALERQSMACVVVGEASAFEKRVNDYLEMPVIQVDVTSKENTTIALEQMKEYQRLVVAIAVGNRSKSAIEGANREALVKEWQEKSSVVAFLGNPYQLVHWKGLEKVKGLLLGYQNNELVQDVSAQTLFGGIGATGRLPVTVKGLFPVGSGEDTQGGLRLKYSLPEAVGMDSRSIHRRVDSIVLDGIEKRAFPGCQVWVACKGSIIFNQAYGFHTYQKREAVDKHDLYDLASLTKVSGPLPLIMRLVDKEVIALDAPMSRYFKDWQTRWWHRSNKTDLVMRNILAHQAGLIPYISYWPMSMKNGDYRRRWYRSQADSKFSLEVSDHLYLRNSFTHRVYKAIRKSELLSAGKYRYSGLSFMVFPAMISHLTGENYVGLLDSLFYKPLGASTLTYNPLHRFSPERVVPTEWDHYFRHQLVHGRVHDEAASVLGGVSGNAGLFSCANDLGKLFQMYLNGGLYGGKQFISKEVIDEFSRIQFPENGNRRGLGFDKPLPQNDQLSSSKAYPAPSVSQESYGHSGFTGTFVWVDPPNELIYVFLSNRVFPTRDNSLIYDLNIRTSVQQVFYDSFL